MDQIAAIWSVAPLGPILLILVPLGALGVLAFTALAWVFLRHGDAHDAMRKPWKDDGP